VDNNENNTDCLYFNIYYICTAIICFTFSRHDVK